ncbi:DUF1330 domain-containing protein [Phenylobacterium sp. J426]|uniref:DUF1330 domain-containing protein n=1 Tax=Phenylobacterium sp. J426 TaxID=2898439 RepID=UPI002150C2D4|nr:DUF1330 domain-containing protein [Phenylobacterium sp. J426]MCR5876017.1 DUF1330 domain-containing protein [Phenylobacterium sp. J426]
MTTYLVGRIAIHDREAYGRYAAAFMPVLQQYGGRLLVSEENPEPLEGDWDGRKLVVLAFDSRDAALTWANSPEYRKIAEDRIAGSDAIVVLAEGFG